MITIPTTFVVGAGGSYSYGLPLGNRLLQLGREVNQGSHIYKLLVGLTPEGNDVDQRASAVDQMIHRLRDYPGRSIDAFLEHQPVHRTIGHELIAALMGEALLKRKGVAINEKEDWLGAIIERMSRGTGGDWRKFASGNADVTFVTFNFDTIIEDRLADEVRRIYGKSSKEGLEVLETIKVIHVHGSLPPIQELSVRWVSDAATKIKVIQDELPEAKVRAARNALTGAVTICFLGFSYHPDNLDTLDLPTSLGGTGTTKNLYGTVVNMAQHDVDEMRQRLGSGFVVGSGSQDCYSFLMGFPILQTRKL